ncbi:hypothetical protein [Nannocystis radixulma]|uniref:NADH:quinone oxidoreductase/Mrp antiporter membrane subunit domain-containing protein n=1 Tax=Nannocystis radixulma TaxID=2995305 RepID=A0ABT5B4R5_9BACT|nr:hypothetical protein [Nannocystis radixulma]MDC0669092.1 hypothetical protein [Nannocystis radixulma]
MGALAAMLLPAAVGLALVGLVGPLERRWGAAAASAATAQAALAAAVLAILLLWQASQRDLLAQRLEWLRVGRTTTIDWVLQIDALGLPLAAVALTALVLGVVANMAFGTGSGGRPGARIALAGGGGLVLASAGTLAQLAIGLGAMVLALRAWPQEHVRESMPDRTWLIGLAGAGLGIAGLAWLAAAGDLDLVRIERSAFGQDGSELVRGRIGGPFFALAPGVVATIAAGTAALAWLLAWPRLLARVWAEGPAPALVATCVAAPALGVILLRTQVAMALAPTGLALLTLAAAGAAAWTGLQAARADAGARVIAAGTQTTLAIAVATVAIGEPIAAAQLLAVTGLAWAAALVGLAAPKMIRAAIVAIAAVGLVAALGAAIAGLWNDLSAWSSGINAAAPALALVGVGGLAVGLRHVLADRTEGPGWAPAEAPSLLLGVGVALALAAAVAGLWPLAPRMWPLFVAGRMFEGAYALGPRPDALVFGAGVGAALVAGAVAVGLVVAPRIAPRPSQFRTRTAGAAGPTVPRLLRLGERLVGRLTLWPGDERLAVAPGRFDVRGPLLLAVAGTLAILGSVYCNRDVIVLGPTRVHPVDLGGLDAAMAGARRGATEATAAGGVRGQAPQPEDGGTGPTPIDGETAGISDMLEGAGGAETASGAAAGAADMPEGAGSGTPASGAGAGAADMPEGAGGARGAAAGAVDLSEGAGGVRGAAAGAMNLSEGSGGTHGAAAGAADMPGGSGDSGGPVAGAADMPEGAGKPAGEGGRP